MRKFDDNQIYRLIRIVPLVVLSYSQLLFWENSNLWIFFQWSTIITSSTALITFIFNIVELVDLDKEIISNKKGLSVSLFLLNGCMFWSFLLHTIRFIGEVVNFIL